MARTLASSTATCALRGPLVARLVDALDRRPQLSHEIVLDARLEVAVPVEPELGWRAARPTPLRHWRNRRGRQPFRSRPTGATAGSPRRRAARRPSATCSGPGSARRPPRALTVLPVAWPSAAIQRWCHGAPCCDPYWPDDAPATPSRSFASDNSAGAHPRVLEAIAARQRRSRAWRTATTSDTRRASGASRELFGREVATFLTFNGTGANVLALMALARPGDAVICTDWAHINVDETGAPERIVGAKLIDLAAPDGKLTPEHDRPIRPTRSASAPRPAGDRVDHPVDRARHGVHRRRDRPRSATSPTGTACASTSTAPGSPTPSPPRAVGRRPAGDDGRRRSRRDVVRRHQERDDGRRGGRVPRSGDRRPGALRPQDGHPAAVEDAVRRRPVQRPARRRPVARRWPATPTRMATALARVPTAGDPRRRRWARRRRSTACSRRSPPPPSRRSRPGASSGTGTSPPSGALDDRLGHRPRTTSSASPAGVAEIVALPAIRIDCAITRL